LAYGAGPQKSPTITTVDIDTARQQILIFGTNFGTSAPMVSLAGEPLNVDSNNDTSIVASLPASFLTNPGTHQLVVTTTGKPSSTVSFIVTIGAVGPPGPVGPRGPQGPQGEIGATGAQGPKGDIGATGATGAQGPKGDIGATGATGATALKAPRGRAWH
jgi:hypothetical protein